MRGCSEQLARWCTKLNYPDLPADVVASTKMRVLDVLGIALRALIAMHRRRAVQTKRRGRPRLFYCDRASCRG
jgi:2-methylcitrate dehydratase PrpD